jgi:hypothetical protein
MNQDRINHYVDAIANLDTDYDMGIIDADEWRERVAAVIATIAQEAQE